MQTYLIITAIVIMVIILLNVIKSKPKPKSKPKTMLDELTNIADKWKTDELQNNGNMKEIYEAIKPLSNEGTDKDIMPEGTGEFGLEITNPIPVDTIFGSYAYLGQLRTLQGKSVEYERIGSMHTPNIKAIIDGYKIKSAGKEIATIYICPYNKKNSERAPKGFNLSPS